MPRILLVKTSSMGDVIHNLPVVTDIQRQLTNTIVDWVVEESFRQIPALHPGVRTVIPVATRRWRKSPGDPLTRRQIRAFISSLRSESYDAVIDTQGLIKSAIIAKLARGERHGYAWYSAREPLASCLYNRRFEVDKTLHAVERNRLLAAKALDYQLNSLALDYGIASPRDQSFKPPVESYAVLLHATSRDDKLWPEENWTALGDHLAKAGLCCQLPWGNEVERQRSERLAKTMSKAQVPDPLTLNDATALLAHAKIVVGVDTGLTHLAAALGVNTVALYIATAPGLTGVYGRSNAINIGRDGRSPMVADVWQAASKLIGA
jgi:heptosyltransferase-1